MINYCVFCSEEVGLDVILDVSFDNTESRNGYEGQQELIAV